VHEHSTLHRQIFGIMQFEKLSFKQLWVFWVIWLRLPRLVQHVIHWYNILPLQTAVNFCLYFTVTCWADKIMVGHGSTCTDPRPTWPIQKVTHLTHWPMTHRPIACSDTAKFTYMRITRFKQSGDLIRKTGVRQKMYSQDCEQSDCRWVTSCEFLAGYCFWVCDNARRPFTVTQSRWFWHQSKGRMRLPISG